MLLLLELLLLLLHRFLPLFLQWFKHVQQQKQQLQQQQQQQHLCEFHFNFVLFLFQFYFIFVLMLLQTFFGQPQHADLAPLFAKFGFEK